LGGFLVRVFTGKSSNRFCYFSEPAKHRFTTDKGYCSIYGG